ncbi:prepilin peptidase [Bermanella marisrubri]|uniref:Prepilin leader peptidase/N-methyltransferase n=1 Tax=Bermanella marisrubri TaxID=207949 RepID=Q1MZP7_9GAMM|nr:A24 family peptidase [Bermanella marisrubri]EAT11510.1 Type 4 prepilin-like proteins leader peptide processing enzyme [Oceanobacter sp. RED65] [Bermanella marisrubri]QIZ85084.1 prepilin peptidase [Bermanella marisrubri]
MFDFLFQDTLGFYLGVFFVSLCVGSFLNVVIYRLPVMMKSQLQLEHDELIGKEVNQPEPFNLMVPSSTCPKCNSKIKPWQNIPVLSYLWLKGKCANCKTSISVRYPIIELITGFIPLGIAILLGPTLEAYALILMSYFFIALTMIDLDEFLLPDQLTLPLIWIGLLFNLHGAIVPLEDAVLGAVFGYMSLWSIFWLFKLATGKEGMGYGDFKLLAAIGAFIGWQLLPVVVLLSSFVGAIVGISMMIVLGRDKNIPIPFGPYLAAAGLLAALWGEEILNHYLRFAGL